MRIAVLLFALSATAHATPGAVELSVDVSGGLPFGNSSSDNSMDQIVDGNEIVGIGGGYRFSQRSSAGIVYDYRARNGNGYWIGHAMTDTPDFVAFHGWLMLGTRVVFDAF